MAADYEEFYDDFNIALAGGKPPHLTGVDLEKHVPASANKHLLENAALALSTPPAAPRVFDWLEWYAPRPLHENEATTSSESYRPAIDYPTLALAGFAADHGRDVLCDVLLDRSRATISDLLLSIGCAPPRKVLDEGTPGKRCVLIGNGQQVALAGSRGFPAMLVVGKRGQVRADTPQGNLGPWHYLYAYVMAVQISQALGLPYAGQKFKRQHGDFENIRRRWPAMRRWGFSATDLELAARYFANPADVAAARTVHGWAAAYPSNEGRLRIRGVDRSVESLALVLGDSSTGGIAISAQRADGVTFRTSCDPGTRRPSEIRPQGAEIDGRRLVCYWPDSPGVEMAIERVVSVEAWRSQISPAGSYFVGAGEPVPGPQPPQPNPPDPTPVPPSSGGPLEYLGAAGPGESLYGSRSSRTIVREIHGEPSVGYPKRWIAEDQ